MASEKSTVLDSAAALRERGSNALDESRVATALREATDWAVALVRASFLYRWLTKEPDPEVVVIDLRETYTVGPFVALLDRLVDALAPIYRQSRLHTAVQVAGELASRAADTRTGRTLVALLEPPEAPEADDTRGDQRDD